MGPGGPTGAKDQTGRNVAGQQPGQDARPPGHRHTGCRAPGPKATEKGHVYGPAHSRLQRTVQRALATPGRNRGAEPMGPRHHGAGPPHQRATEKKKRPRIETRARTAIEGRAARTRQAPAKPQGALGPAPGGPPETRYGRRALQGRPRETRSAHPRTPGPGPGARRGTLCLEAQELAPEAHRRHATGGVHSKVAPGNAGHHTPRPRGQAGPGARVDTCRHWAKGPKSPRPKARGSPHPRAPGPSWPGGPGGHM